ncbi:MAG: SDR family oxidoreductase [Dehalococcoidia bacterium]|jgi:3-oxoacyl-[acyl-carrier protein] reductase|nr:MAG: 3-oxoacyl-[acyl-carrier protein] reductase [Chloroflexota bacterium]
MEIAINGCSAIISGGTKGIGLAIAKSLLDEGVNVTVFSRNIKNLQIAKKLTTSVSTNAHAHFIQADITKNTDRKKIISQHLKKFSSLDFLINNAGQSIKNGSSESKWTQSFNVNVTAHALLTELALPSLEKSKNGASVVNIASIYGRESGGNAHYNASKAAMISFSKTTSNLLIAKGIRVNSVAPGSILFPNGSWDKRVKSEPKKMKDFVKQNIPAGRFGTVEEIANVVTFLLSPKSSWIVGATINVDGGQSKSNI